AASLIANVIMRWRGVEPRSGLWRVFVYRLAEGSLFTPLLPREQQGGGFLTPHEHAEVIARLTASTKNEGLRHTPDVVAPHPENSWVPAFNRVQYEVGASGSCGKRKNKSGCARAEVIRDAVLRTGEYLAQFFYKPFFPDSALLSWERLTQPWGL